MKAPELEAPSTGEVVGDGRFELLSNLGEGGTSVVYRAHDCRLGVEVALKLLLPRYVGRPEREQRLINEAEYLRRLRGHPHIVEFVDAGRLEDRGRWPWLATEVLTGQPLDMVFVRGTLEIARIVEVAKQIAAGLHACHTAGVVHRDATPSNVFTLDDASGTIKLFDFSHAADLCAPQLAVGAPGRLTGVHDVPGTLGYMGPEQVRQEAADPSMDAFGFGVLLFELVTRQNPYAHIQDRGAYIQGQREGKLEAPRLHAWAYGAPEELGELVHDCTKRLGAERPTMEQIIERLGSIDPTAVATGTTPTPTPVLVPDPTVKMDLRPAPEPPDPTAWRSAPPGADATVNMQPWPAPDPGPDATADMQPWHAPQLGSHASMKVHAPEHGPDTTAKVQLPLASQPGADATAKVQLWPAPQSGLDATAKVQLRPEPGPDTTAKLQLRPEPGPDTTAKVQLRPEPGSDATARVQLRPEPGPDATAKVQLRPEPGPDATAKVQLRPEPGPDATAKVQLRPEPGPDTTAKVQLRPEPGPDATAKVQLRPEPGPDATAKVQLRPEPGPDTTAKVQLRPEPGPDTTAKVQLRPEPGPDATAKVQLRPEPGPDATQEMDPGPTADPVPDTTVKVASLEPRLQRKAAAIGAWGPPPSTQPAVAEPLPAQPAQPVEDVTEVVQVAKAVNRPASEWASEQDDDTAQLAFARPPQLRPAPAPAPKTQPAVEPEPEPEPTPDAPPLSNRRAGFWWVVIALLLVGVIAFVGWRWLHEPPSDEPAPAPTQTKQRAEPIPAPAPAPVPHLEPVPEVEPTPDPVVQPKPQPKPKPKPEPEPTPKPEPDACEGVADQARKALADRNWRRALSLSANRKCWASQAERAALRVDAFSELGEWTKCVEAGSGSTDSKVRAKVDGCRMFATPETSP
ncbi:TldD protein [Enhygromyxa salina]|uniref:TldD protein n=1 Tax=Enhygromyxa salina TaxID=215803 RepID=A0A0C2D0B5_9BACT|nr:serine/threonine-protein kinase [Enhygromyxa salina]KIG15270.1 TldD protein [Enhygromyxa salina]